VTDEAIYKIEVPGTAEEVYAIARALYDQRRHNEVVVLCEQAEAAGTFSGEVFAVHSASLLRLRRAGEAIELLEPRLQDYPDNAKMHFNLGSAYNTTFQRSKAREEYAVARRLDPELIGKNLRRSTLIRVAFTASCAVLVTIALVFWPHTRWLLEAFFAVLIALTLLTVIMSFKASPRRALPLAGILLAWIAFLLLTILAPAHFW
jgi:tetratricopeptide (TPR) repeat protein